MNIRLNARMDIKEERLHKRKIINLLLLGSFTFGVFLISACGSNSSIKSNKIEMTEKKTENVFNITAFKDQTTSEIEKMYGKPIKTSSYNWSMADTGEKIKVVMFTYEINDDEFEFSFFKDVLGMVHFYPNKDNQLSKVSAQQLKNFDFSVFGLPSDNLQVTTSNAVTWRGFKDISSVTLIGTPNKEATEVPNAEYKFVLDHQYR